MTYKYVDTNSIITELQGKGLVKPDAVVKFSFRGQRPGWLSVQPTKDTTHVARVPFGDTVELFDTKVQPELLLWNSYQGESCFKAKLGFFRFVCANGMAVGNAFEGAEIKLRHTVGPKWSREYDTFFGNVELLMKRGIEQMQGLVEHKLTQGQMIAIIERLGFSKSTTDLMVNALIARQEDQTNNLYQLWNVTNEVMKARSRSELAFEQRNDLLLPNLIRLAKAA